MTASGRDLRQYFLDFFARHGHTVVKSAPLIPANDPTLMFTNAGMVPFKDVFVGREQRDYVRAVSAQKCMRVSGKHNDLEQVGRTARHHTFFEMLGNFSFGDYFKEEAIVLCWRFLTEELQLPSDRLWVTVFGGAEGIPADDEARQLWVKVSGLPPSRILSMGMSENFWAMGETGPCGPCTEVHFDLGGSGEPTLEDFEQGRVVEIWNNVFMQFNRHSEGRLEPLPKPSVDTGMGLERLAAVVQGCRSNYDCDLFTPLLEHVSTLANRSYQHSDAEEDVSMRVVADHARATAFLVADGIQPSNEARGYVLRRIMRRAIRHGRRLGLDDLFFHRACDAVVALMRDAYPELEASRTLLQKVAENEEQGFRRTLDTGLKLLEETLASAQASGARTLPGHTVFKLYDTYGFPKDLTETIATERGWTLDEEGFAAAMAAQKERSRGSEVGEEAVGDVYQEIRRTGGPVRFEGYDHESTPLTERAGTWRRRITSTGEVLEMETVVRALVADGQRVDSVEAGHFEVVLNPTPFYGESGGQAGDPGTLHREDLTAVVADSVKPLEELTISRGTITQGRLEVGQRVWAGYRPEIRQGTRVHHSATHLLHGALRQTLGEHVKQAGSLVAPDRLRFDFSHFEAPTPAQLRAVETDAYRRVAANHTVVTDILPFEEARARGAIAMFGEKYGDVVRVVTMGESVEFCGGTHAAHTSDIGWVLITRDEAVSSGVRRIEAEVGEAAKQRVQNWAQRLRASAALLRGENAPPEIQSDGIVQAVAKMMREHERLQHALANFDPAPTPPNPAVDTVALSETARFEDAQRLRDTWQALVQLTNARPADALAVADAYADIDISGVLRAFAQVAQWNRTAERRLEDQQRDALGDQVEILVGQAENVCSIRLVTAHLPDVSAKQLRSLADRLRDRLGSCLVCLATGESGKVSVLIALSKDLVPALDAGALLKEVAPLVEGRGGGKAELAQGGGTRVEGLPSLFAAVTTHARSALESNP